MIILSINSEWLIRYAPFEEKHFLDELEIHYSLHIETKHCANSLINFLCQPALTVSITLTINHKSVGLAAYLITLSSLCL